MQIHVSPRQWEITERSALRVWQDLMQTVSDRIEYIKCVKPRTPDVEWGPLAGRDQTEPRWIEHYTAEVRRWEQCERYSRLVIDHAGLYELYRSVPPGELHTGGLWNVLDHVKTGSTINLFGHPIQGRVVRADKAWEKRVTLL